MEREKLLNLNFGHTSKPLRVRSSTVMGPLALSHVGNGGCENML